MAKHNTSNHLINVYWSLIQNLTVDKLKKVAKLWLGTKVNKMKKHEVLDTLYPYMKKEKCDFYYKIDFTPFERSVLHVLDARDGMANAHNLRAELLMLDIHPDEIYRKPHIRDQTVQFLFHRDYFRTLKDKGVVIEDIYRTSTSYSFSTYDPNWEPDITLVTHPAILRMKSDSVPPVQLPSVELKKKVRRPYIRNFKDVLLDIVHLCELIEKEGELTIAASTGYPHKRQMRRIEKAFSSSEQYHKEIGIHSGKVEFCFGVMTRLGLLEERRRSIRVVSSLKSAIRKIEKKGPASLWEVYLNSYPPGNYVSGNIKATNRLLLKEMIMLILIAIPPEEGWISVKDINEILWSKAALAISSHPALSPDIKFEDLNRSSDIPEDKIADIIFKEQRKDWEKEIFPLVEQIVLQSFFELGMVHVALGERGEWYVKASDDLVRRISPRTPKKKTISKSDEPWLVVQPNFEILVHFHHVPVHALTRLGEFAHREKTASHTMVYRLTRESVYKAMESGFTVQEITEFLEEASQHAIPGNIIQQLEEWEEHHHMLQVYSEPLILEFENTAARKRYLAKHNIQGFEAGGRFFVATEEAPSFEHYEKIIDYDAPPMRCLEISETGDIILDTDKADLLVRNDLQEIAVPDGNSETATSWKLSPQKCRKRAENSVTKEDVRRFLTARSKTTIPSLVFFLLHSWMRDKDVIAIDAPLIMYFPQYAQMEMFMKSSLMKEYIKGVIPRSNALIIDEKKRSEFEKKLKELDVEWVKHLAPEPLPFAKKTKPVTTTHTVSGTTAGESITGKIPLYKVDRWEKRRLIERSIYEEKDVVILYKSRNRATPQRRRVTPLEFYSLPGGSYIIAYCHLRNAERQFNLSNIIALALVE